jgi:hypothetical protein
MDVLTEEKLGDDGRAQTHQTAADVEIRLAIRLAESYLIRRLFVGMLAKIAVLPSPTG